MNFECGFEPREQALVKEWAGSVEQSLKWSLVTPVGIGESEPWEAEEVNGLTGIVKRAELVTATQTIWAGAHEKIAADLAKEIGVCVPPVTLWRDGSSGIRYAVSAKAFAQYEHWEVAQGYGLITDDVRSKLLPALAGGYVFHNWIGDNDHWGGDLNLVISTTDASVDVPGLAFVDHTRSMSFRWRREGAALATLLPRYYVNPRVLPKAALQTSINRILSVDVDTIQDIVFRVPNDYLSREIANMIFEGLQLRLPPLVHLVNELVAA